MIKVNDVARFIEEKYDIKLYSYQRLILKAIIRGDTIYTPRGVGRTMLYNGYAEYLKSNQFDKQFTLNRQDDFDTVFTLSGVCKQLYEENPAHFEQLRQISEEMYNKDYEYKF